MVGFSYIYKTQKEIFDSLTQLKDLALGDILIIVLFVTLLFIFTFIIAPSIIITYRHINIQKSKKNKKKILTQILLQKEIEDQVEKEIQIEEEKKIT